ncbi:MAG: 30S ribosomal protein S9 [Candidatus Micrarchaeota archaeon]|nr:30S ribosomal protein S9 [Candidatus Micrarchaeota archaeon]
MVFRGKRKESVARASIRKGKGVVRINSQLLSSIDNKYVREIISEPLRLAPEIASQVDISVNVYGGGQMGQAQACRVAIAHALVGFSGGSALKEKMLSYDRSLLAEDSRRVEPKKYKGPKARARFQKSYR